MNTLSRKSWIASLLLTFFTGQAFPQNIDLVRIATGFSNPLFVTAPPNDFNRLFVVEQGSGGSASIKILDLNTRTINPTPFLTLSGIPTGGEEGLLGLAFHPDYASNGRFYVNHTSASGDIMVRQFLVSGDPNVANAASGTAVLTVPHPINGNHNGGWLGFGPDRNLYVATGDGGSGNDPPNNAQNINVLLGKMLRLDVNSDDFPADPTRNYAIPASNPFAGATAGADEIWAYGLRNPWRNSFDRQTGDLWIGDVGQGAREEINYQSAATTTAVNYGWRAREGSIDNSGVSDPAPSGAVDPIHDYAAVAGGNAVVGGYVYGGTNIAGLQGTYFFADTYRDQVWSLQQSNGVAINFTERTAELTPDQGALSFITSFGEGANGEIFMTTGGGDVFQIVPEPSTISLAALGLMTLLVYRRRRSS